MAYGIAPLLVASSNTEVRLSPIATA